VLCIPWSVTLEGIDEEWFFLMKLQKYRGLCNIVIGKSDKNMVALLGNEFKFSAKKSKVLVI